MKGFLITFIQNNINNAKIFVFYTFCLYFYKQKIGLMRKNNFYLIETLRKDLTKAYCDVVKSYCPTQQYAWEKTAKHPAPRFYVSPSQAYNKLRLMVRGDMSDVDNMEPLRKQMYYDLFNILQVIAQQKQFLGRSLWFICPFLVAQPAPQFYLSSETVRKTLKLSKKYGYGYRHSQIYPTHKLTD